MLHHCTSQAGLASNTCRLVPPSQVMISASLQAAAASSDRVKALEAAAAELQREKCHLEKRFKDCRGELEAAQDQLRHALATQEAAQTHLARLQKVRSWLSKNS